MNLPASGYQPLQFRDSGAGTEKGPEHPRRRHIAAHHAARVPRFARLDSPSRQPFTAVWITHAVMVAGRPAPECTLADGVHSASGASTPRRSGPRCRARRNKAAPDSRGRQSMVSDERLPVHRPAAASRADTRMAFAAPDYPERFPLERPILRKPRHFQPGGEQQ